jgi:organic radical activating enzyme
VITGGEPLTWDMDANARVEDRGMTVHIETSGAYPMSEPGTGYVLIKCQDAVAGIYDRADELKMIIYNESDFAFTWQKHKKYLLTTNLFCNRMVRSRK